MDDLKELQELVNFLFDLPDTYEKVKSDGKVDFADLQYALPLFLSAKSGIDGIGNPLQRWKALQPHEKDVVKATAKLRFDIDDDVLEMLIERWFEAGVMVAELVADTITYSRKPAQPQA